MRRGWAAFAARLASLTAEVAAKAALFRLPDERVVISPFKAEAYTPVQWQRVMHRLRQEGSDVALVPLFLDYRAHVDNYASLSHGLSHWGFRSPKANASLEFYASDAHRRGKVWMQPVSLQDSRPYRGVYDEACNTENYRLTWEAAITHGAEWVHIPTWNDYSENTAIAPSTRTGWAPLDIASYYLTWFKSGSAPAIVGDMVYLSHRTHAHRARPVLHQSELMTARPGTSDPRDTVEVLSFFTEPAVVTLRVGQRTVQYEAPEGVHAHTAPLAAGQVSVQAVRRGRTVSRATSECRVTDRPRVQDLLYHMTSSSRR
jgi:hypothetical protein